MVADCQDTAATAHPEATVLRTLAAMDPDRPTGYGGYGSSDHGGSGYGGPGAEYGGAGANIGAQTASGALGRVLGRK